MLIVAQHTVLDPAVFWKTAAEAQLPDHLRLLQLLPSQDGSRGVCLWQAPSIEELRDFIDPAVGQVSRNEYFAVQEANAVGLPGMAASAAQQPA